MVLSHPQDIADIGKADSQGKMAKGFVIYFIKTFLLGNGFAALDTTEQYRELRRLMYPFFSPAKLAELRQSMVDLSKRTIERLTNIEGATEYDWQREMTFFSMSVITHCMLGYEIHPDEAARYSTILSEVARYVNQRQMSSPFQLPSWAPTAANRQYKRNYQAVVELVERIIENDEEKEARDEGEGTLIRTIRQAKLSKEVLYDQIINIFFGGHETTSHTLTMCFYRMLKNPEIYAKLKAEIRRNSEQNLNPVTTNGQQDHENFPYLFAFINEVLRLDSPINIYGRNAREKLTLKRGITIPKGTLVIMSQYSTHRMNEFWEMPEVFNPERFLGEESMNDMLKARKFFPFGVGSRSCVGRHFMYDEVANFINEFLKQEVEITLPESYEAVKKIICTSKLDGGLPVAVYPKA